MITLRGRARNRKKPRDGGRVSAGRNGNVARITTGEHANGKLSGKRRLLTRRSLDNRTRAARQFDAIAQGIAADLGGEDRLSTVQRHLVEAFAGCALHVHDINAHLLLGEPVDIIVHCQAISTMVRVAARIGVLRLPRDIGSSLGEIIRSEPRYED